MRRQVVRTHRRAAGKDGGTLDRILQLPHVAGPRVTEQAFNRFGRQAELAVQFPGRARQEVLGQRGDVLAPLAERWHHDPDDVEPIEEVVAEHPLADHLHEIAVGGGQHAHVGGESLRRPQPSELAALQHAQELDLERGRHLADLVQEQGAAMGFFEQAELAGDGPGEGAAHVAEQLGLQ